jgi:hypothetical protein
MIAEKQGIGNRGTREQESKERENKGARERGCESASRQVGDRLKGVLSHPSAAAAAEGWVNRRGG